MNKDSNIAEGFKWYLVTAERPDGVTVSKFIVGRKRKAMLSKLKKQLKGSNWKAVDVRYLDSDVTVFAARHSAGMWKS